MPRSALAVEKSAFLRAAIEREATRVLDLQVPAHADARGCRDFRRRPRRPAGSDPRALSRLPETTARAWFMPTERPAYRIERFDPARHDRADFDCGVDRLNNYLKLTARKQQKDDMTRVYDAIEEGSPRILGYHAINLGMMNVDELKRRPRGSARSRGDPGAVPGAGRGRPGGTE